MKTRKEVITIIGLLNKRQDIELAPIYQRNFVWNMQKQKGLIQTIQKQLNFMPKFLMEVTDKKGIKWSVIDGQQRLTTIMAYITNTFKNKQGRYYKDLTQEDKNIFNNYNLDITLIEDATDSEIDDMFILVNNYEPLRQQEKRIPKRGEISKFVVKTVKALNVFDSLIKDNQRLSRDEMLVKVLSYKLNGLSGDNALNNMYKTYAFTLPDNAIKAVLSNLNVMSKMVGNLKLRKPEFFNLYLLAEYLDNKNIVNVSDKDLKGIGRWFYQTESIRKKDERYLHYILKGNNVSKSAIDYCKQIIRDMYDKDYAKV